MKAIQTKDYGGEDQLKLVEVPQPKAEKGQVVVRIAATTFNPIDVKLTSGDMRQMFPLQFPFVPGADFSGVVDSVGEGVAQFRAGDEVWGYSPGGGAYAEYIAIEADKIGPKPRTLTHIESASLPLVGQTALQMVERAGIRNGQTVLIHGAGGAVGSVAVQEARRRGATVIANGSTGSADRLKSYGANRVIDYETTPFENSVRNVDVVLDTVGGDTLQRSYEVLKEGGVLVAITQPPSEQEAAKRRLKASMVLTQPNSATLKTLSELADSGEIKPFVGKVYPLSEAANAWRDNHSHHVDGKIAFKVSAEAEQTPKPPARRSATASE
jgi:NADPH:quinone reductase-like Zn-dependent oxidoreductase